MSNGQEINSWCLSKLQCHILLQVAQHLARTYGDKAFKVAKLCSMTGKRWPVVGKRLHEEYPYIEAEVSGSVLGKIIPYYFVLSEKPSAMNIEKFFFCSA